MKNSIRQFIRRFGFDIVRSEGIGTYPPDFDELSQEICKAVEPYTMTPPARVDALVAAVKYVVDNSVDGALVECGVWRGGSAMAMALTLKRKGIEDRDLYLYDTFAGMTAPGDVDVSISGKPAFDEFAKLRTSDDTSEWCLSPLDEVKKNLATTAYPSAKLHFIEGKVEETIPQNIPDKIAILRLDTDWYESTKHEMTHLFPRLQPAGVLIIDDYGHWKGSRKAVDEYIAENKIRILLNRLDYSGRIAVKV